MNLIITMLLGGLWHGAAWNFVLWGLWHGTGLAVERSWLKPRETSTPFTHRLLGWATTLVFVFYGWLLFRARSFTQILDMTRALADFTAPAWTATFVLNLLVFATPLVLMEAWQFKTRNPLTALALPTWARTSLQGGLLIAIVIFWDKKEVPFIYFQF